MVDIDQDGATADGPWLKPLAAERDMLLAVYGDVASGGAIRVGDQVFVLSRPALPLNSRSPWGRWLVAPLQTKARRVADLTPSARELSPEPRGLASVPR